MNVFCHGLGLGLAAGILFGGLGLQQTPAQGPSAPERASAALKVLRDRCYECHGRNKDPQAGLLLLNPV